MYKYLPVLLFSSADAPAHPPRRSAACGTSPDTGNSRLLRAAPQNRLPAAPQVPHEKRKIQTLHPSRAPGGTWRFRKAPPLSPPACNKTSRRTGLHRRRPVTASWRGGAPGHSGLPGSRAWGGQPHTARSTTRSPAGRRRGSLRPPRGWGCTRASEEDQIQQQVVHVEPHRDQYVIDRYLNRLTHELIFLSF